MSNFTYHKINEEEYEVSEDGVVLGNIVKGWTRIGGVGWVVMGQPHIGTSHKTREQAARSMARESKGTKPLKVAHIYLKEAVSREVTADIDR
jgi:hypothetical protein